MTNPQHTAQAWSRTHLRDEPASRICRCLVGELNKAKALAFLGARVSAHMQRSRHQAVCMRERQLWVALQLQRGHLHCLQ